MAGQATPPPPPPGPPHGAPTPMSSSMHRQGMLKLAVLDVSGGDYRYCKFLNLEDGHWVCCSIFLQCRVLLFSNIAMHVSWWCVVCISYVSVARVDFHCCNMHPSMLQ
ncbi:hypothetical protein GQ55_8G122800 [Panicum hallii var. hallii]|uniref:Uncharacterized protein n=1 Tax=Panicum hallii var. hallii TaxID=1504633 RepID=A0A2T7CN19_9POAL|nr:hypothetical protein GQ55_8G122800 [Panicum hallii var. hallii]